MTIRPLEHINPLQTTWLEPTTVSSRVALLLRSAEHVWRSLISPPVTRPGPPNRESPGRAAGSLASLQGVAVVSQQALHCLVR